MAALDFPASPTVGQKYPSPAVTGVPVYSWDGEKWTTLGGAIGSTGGSDAVPLPDTTTGTAGSSTLWSRGDHTHPANSAPYVRYDAPQGLTAPQIIQARQNIYAAPFDAMAYSGLQINGAMEVSQEHGSSLVSGVSGYVVDGWLIYASGFAVSAQQVADGPAGFTASLKVSVTTAVPSIGAGDYIQIYHPIEGYRTARLWWGSAAASPITIGFWVKAHRAGMYSGNIANGANNRVYVFSFPINGADIWEFKTITVPGDVTGVWAQGISIGLALRIAVAVGATYQIPPNVWATNNAFGAAGTVNGGAATSDTFQITGVTVLPGNEAPSAARSPFIMRSYDQELQLCQRYYECTALSSSGVQLIGVDEQKGIGEPLIWTWVFKTEKRATPTVSATGSYSPVALVGGISFVSSRTNACATGLALAAGRCYWYLAANSNFIADARL